MRRVWFGLMVFLAVAIAIGAPLPWLLGAVEDGPGVPALVPHLLERFDVAHGVFLGHVIAAGIALLVAPFQLIARLRWRFPNAHRATGVLYVATVAVGGITGFVMGATAWAGPIARAGFMLLAIAWLATTAIGLARILAGDHAGHRAWMTRSFALVFAAVSLRLQLLVFGAIGLDFETAYATVAWSCWVPNLLIAQLLLVRRSESDRRSAPLLVRQSEKPST